VQEGKVSLSNLLVAGLGARDALLQVGKVVRATGWIVRKASVLEGKASLFAAVVHG